MTDTAELTEMIDPLADHRQAHRRRSLLTCSSSSGRRILFAREERGLPRTRREGVGLTRLEQLPRGRRCLWPRRKIIMSKPPLHPDRALESPRTEWARGHFPLMATARDVPTRQTFESGARGLSFAPGHAFDIATV